VFIWQIYWSNFPCCRVHKGLRPLEIYWHPLGWHATPFKNHWHIVSKWSHNILCRLEVAQPNCGPLLYHKDNEWWKLTFRPMATTVVLHPWASEGGQRPLVPPWILKISTKKVIFLILSGKKQISPLLAPWKNFGKIPSAPPLEKILSKSMVTS